MCTGFVLLTVCILGLYCLQCVYWVCIAYSVCTGFVLLTVCVLGLYCLQCVFWVCIAYSVCTGFVLLTVCVLVLCSVDRPSLYNLVNNFN